MRDAPSIFEPVDLAMFGLMALVAGLTRTVPIDRWRALTNAAATSSLWPKTRHAALFPDRVRAIFGDGVSDEQIGSWLVDLRNSVMGRPFTLLADLNRVGWQPTFTYDGLEQIEEARCQSRGAVLWFDDFSYRQTVGLRAVAEAGYRFAILSTRSHGLSNSRLGMRTVNRPWVRQQLKYAFERVAFDPSETVVATRRVMRVLDSGELVVIANNGAVGAITHLQIERASIPVATTPFGLAQKGVPVLPVAVVETEPFAAYHIAVGAPLVATQTADKEEARRQLAEAYADWLLRWVRAYPGQWWGWRQLRLSGSDG